MSDVSSEDQSDTRVPNRRFRHLRVLALVGIALLVVVPVAAGAPPQNSQSEGDMFEPNDGFDAATTLSVPAVHSGRSASADDPDYYAVELAQGDQFTASIDFDTAEGDIDLFVYDPNRDVVAVSHSFTDDEIVSVQAAVDGTYYISVQSWNETATDYTLSVNRTDGDLPANDAYEYNDGVASATAISLPFDRSELQIHGQDVDVYAVELATGRQLNVSATFVHDRTDIDLELYDPQQNAVSVSATSSDNESVSTVASSDGAHYVRVTSETAGTAYYSLTVTGDAITNDTRTPTTEPTASTASEQPPTTQRATSASPRTTDASGPGFGVSAAAVAVGLFVLVRRL